MTSLFSDRLAARLGELEAEHRYRRLVRRGEVSFVHNDYLGLSEHPEIREAGRRALEKNPAGSGGSRLLGGHHEIFENLESELADFFGAPSALFFSTGYLANLSFVPAVAPLCERVVSDEKNHASLIDGVRLTRLPRVVLPHGDWAAWETEGAAEASTLFVAESLYSMDGDCVDWDAVCRAGEAGRHVLWIDESHAAGIFGAQGRGLGEDRRDWEHTAVMVTFGKAFGVGGAAILSSVAVREWLVNSARSFVYSTAPSPVLAAMVQASLSVLRREGGVLRRELWRRSEAVRDFFAAEGAPVPPANGIWNRRSPIVPFLISGNDRALRFCESMRESSVELRAIRYPTVAKGAERVRISLNLAVSYERTLDMAKEMVKRWKEFL